MTVLSRRGFVGIGKEGTPYTYQAPTFYFPVMTPAAEDVYAPIRDESIRANDTVLQGLYQGPGESTFGMDILAYPDALPYLLRGIIGPDTVTPGVSTTLAANCAANATSLSLTASVASNSVIQISDSAGANLEWVKVGTVSGAGPYTAPVAIGGGTGGNSTRFAHTAVGGSVLSQSTHTFAQNPAATQVTYSLTKYDVAVNSSGTSSSRGFAGCKLSELQIKIDPKAALSMSAKWIGFPSATQSDPTAAFTQTQPMLGWQWALTNAGGASTRGLTYDLTLKRATEAIHSSNGLQTPREVFQAGFEADGALKVIFENDTDLNLFLQYSQLPVTSVLTQPATSGGSVLTLTNSKGGFTKFGNDLTGAYITASADLSAVYNSTDVGAMTATVTNFVSTAY